MGFELLSPHVRIEASEEKRIEDAIEALKADEHAPRKITVELVLNVHRAYPKHVVVGVDEDGEPVTVTVNSAEEETEALAKVAAAAKDSGEEPSTSGGQTIQ